MQPAPRIADARSGSAAALPEPGVGVQKFPSELRIATVIPLQTLQVLHGDGTQFFASLGASQHTANLIMNFKQKPFGEAAGFRRTGSSVLPLPDGNDRRSNQNGN